MSTDSGPDRSGTDITGYVNFRDLGGHATHDGRVLTGKLFRSDSLAHVGDSDIDHLVGNLGIRTAIDLRHDVEVQDYPLDTLSAAGVHIHHIPLFDPSRPSMLPDDIASLTLAKIYRDLLESAGARLIDALRVVSAELGEPLVFMCSAGKDRTGVLAALVLGLVGVSDTDIVADYAATGSAVEQIVARAGARGSAAAAVGLEHLLYAEAENMESTLEWLHATYGGFAPWALANGYTEVEITALRAALVGSEPVGSEPVGSE
jgi:protein-tyrosine phosphatase